MGRGTKFNARQEEAIGMEWMGLKRWRFYLKCSSCSQEMTFLTDPENDHYVTENGCTRNFEPWRVKEEVNKILDEKKKEIESDSIRSLENKSSIIKQQMDLMDTIRDLQDVNKKNAFMDHDKVIDKLSKKRKLSQMNEDNLQIEEFKEKKKQKIVQNKLLPFQKNEANDKNNKFDFGFKPTAENIEKQREECDNNTGITRTELKKKKRKKKLKKRQKRTIQL